MICSIKECDEDHHGKGYCSSHYQRFKRYGDPLKVLRGSPTICKICGDKKHYAKGLCDKHYHEEYIKNNPNKRLKWMMDHFTRLGKPFDMTSSEYSFANKSWRDTIKNRDNYTCQICKFEGDSKTIHAHHILFKSLYPNSV